MQQRTWRRRNYFIKKDLQGRFVLRFFLTVLLGAIIFTFIFSLFSAHTITITYKDSYLRVERTPKALFYEMIRAHGVYIFLLGVVISILSLFLSHRIAGPLYRFERSAEEVAKGNLSFRIALRKRDEAKELADTMNTMIEAIAGRIRDIRNHAEAVHTKVTQLSEKLDSEELTIEKIKEDISDTIDSVENLKGSISFFRIDKD